MRGLNTVMVRSASKGDMTETWSSYLRSKLLMSGLSSGVQSASAYVRKPGQVLFPAVQS
jgi:hypothetical protein